MTADYKVVYHPGATEDLNAIRDYIAVVGQRPLTALRVVDRLEAAANGVRTFPHGYPVFSAAPPRESRVVVSKPYLIYYEIFEPDRVVRVLYFWHGRRGTRPDFARQDDPLA